MNTNRFGLTFTYCPKCGGYILLGAKKCPKCGVDLNGGI